MQIGIKTYNTKYSCDQNTEIAKQEMRMHSAITNNRTIQGQEIQGLPHWGHFNTIFLKSA